MSKHVVRKAVIPAAGYGTRMLPFTKAVPKELIPLVDKPVLQYVVEEAVASGIEEILLIISAGKEAVLRHFAPDAELEAVLQKNGKTAMVDELHHLDFLGAKITAVYQEYLNGLGGAVALAKDFAGDEPVAVLLGDTVLDSGDDVPVTAQLIEVYEQYHASVIALENVAPEKVSSYGIADAQEIADRVWQLRDLIEKPSIEEAPGNLAVASRYLFTPGIFAALEKTVPGLHHEIQLTDAVRILLQNESVYGRRISGRRFDLGSKSGFIAANLEFAMRCPELKENLDKMLKQLLECKN